jgi:S-adenosylmethionine synthetase
MGRTSEVKTITFQSGSGELAEHEVETFTWEKLDMVDELKNIFSL